MNTKFLKKEVTILGKTMPLLVAAMLVASGGVATAALVSYLSNMMAVSTTVSSPLQMTYSFAGSPPGTCDVTQNGEDYSAACEGGESIRGVGTTENKAGVDMPLTSVIVFKDMDGSELTIKSDGCAPGQEDNCQDWDGIGFYGNMGIEGYQWWTHDERCQGKPDVKYFNIDGTDYYVVLLGGYFTGDVITNGIFGSYTSPNCDSPTANNIAAGGKVAGRVEITFDANTQPNTYPFKAMAAMPGYTGQDVINELFLGTV
ncbi:MAG: hypothetical protein V1900_04100 [Candidatus Aenigmatarchaeota archaeon]